MVLDGLARLDEFSLGSGVQRSFVRDRTALRGGDLAEKGSERRSEHDGRDDEMWEEARGSSDWMGTALFSTTHSLDLKQTIDQYLMLVSSPTRARILFAVFPTASLLSFFVLALCRTSAPAPSSGYVRTYSTVYLVCSPIVQISSVVSVGNSTPSSLRMKLRSGFPVACSGILKVCTDPRGSYHIKIGLGMPSRRTDWEGGLEGWQFQNRK